MLATIVVVTGLTMRCRSGEPPSVESPPGAPSVADGIDATGTTSTSLVAYAFECDDQQRFVLFRVPKQPRRWIWSSAIVTSA